MVTRVVTAVRRDIRAIAERDATLAKSGLAASALALAAELDETRSPSIAIDALRDIRDESEDETARDMATRALEAIRKRPGSSAAEKAQCARVLLQTMDRLRELAPAEDEGAGADVVDVLAARRDERRAG